jgi:hypothetical protein
MSRNGAMPAGIAATNGTDVQPSAGSNSDVSTLKQLMDAGDCKKMGSAAASGTAAQPSAGTNSEVITSQHIMNAGNCDFDGAGDDILATRISD